MSATLLSREGKTVTLKVKFDLAGSMLETEKSILVALNEAGCLATEEALKGFDTDGSRITLGGEKWFSKGPVPKIYQTPYGEVEVPRHVYQRSQGGKTFCPLEQAARIVVTSTPRFAQQVAHKFAQNASTQVQEDLAENHGRPVARSYLQSLSDAVGSVAQSQEETWLYTTPQLEQPILTVSIGLDGTCLLLCQGGYREAMVGTLALYDAQGERQHTIYLGATPQHGKADFMARLEREIAHVKALYPEATYVGIADGTKTNWTFLEHHTTMQVLDFYHATQYLAAAAEAAFAKDLARRTQWLDQRCHDLKHQHGAAARILREMEGFSEQQLSEPLREKLRSAITYFRNHKHQMRYPYYQAQHLPIGSGITEAACKTLVKQRLGRSGMRWRERGAGIVLSLRGLVLSQGRWQQFWNKIDQYGLPVGA
jgi:hypothetical protein